MRNDRVIGIMKEQLQKCISKSVSNSNFGHIIKLNDNDHYYIQFMVVSNRLYLEASSNHYLLKRFRLDGQEILKMIKLGWILGKGENLEQGNLGPQSKNFYMTVGLAQADLVNACEILSATLFDIFRTTGSVLVTEAFEVEKDLTLSNNNSENNL